MPRFVALLRGVNVGGAKRVPMAEFRAMLEASGYRDVQTLLNSGNAVFSSNGRSGSAHASRIQAAIADTLHLEVPVVVKSAQEMAAVAAGNTLAAIASDPSRLLVAFTRDAAALRALAPVAALAGAADQVVVGAHAMYLWCPGGILESKAAAALLGKPGKGATTRNWATVLKISALLGQAGD